MTILQLLEEFKDISKADKLIHQTNAYSFFKIMESGSINPSKFDYGSKEVNKPLTSNQSGNEIATARKSTFSSMDKLPVERQKEFRENLSSGIGGIRIHLFKDRLKSNKYNRGLKIKPISEFNLSEVHNIFSIIQTYEKDDTMAKQNLKYFINYITKNMTPKDDVKNWNIMKESPLFYKYKIPVSEKEVIYQHAWRYVKYLSEREGEERISLAPGDKISLNKELLEVEFLPGFLKELCSTISSYGYVKYYNQIRRWGDIFIKNSEYNKTKKFFLDFMAGRIGGNEIRKIGGISVEKEKNFLKSEGKKTLSPTKEEIDEFKKTQLKKKHVVGKEVVDRVQKRIEYEMKETNRILASQISKKWAKRKQKN